MELWINSLEKEIEGRFGELSPNRILREIVESPGRMKPYTFIVLGRPGPTGKTWLTAGLREYGFNAIELSESIYECVDYADDRNRVIENHINKTVTIILNKRLN